MRRILITGGTGFVGSHLVRLLKSRDATVTVLSAGHTTLQEVGVEYCTADLRNSDDVGAIVRAVNPRQIYHLAGVTSVAESWDDPRRAFEVNVTGTLNLLESAMRLPGPPRILNVSTAQVYAHSDAALPENAPLAPDNPYAATKAMAELLTVQYRQSITGGIITARAFNHTGPGQLPTFALPSFAKQLAEMEVGIIPPVLKVGNVDVKRDFTDVRDVVAAYCQLLDRAKTGEVYNVCSGRAVLLADILRELQSHCRVPVKIEVDPARLRPNEVWQMLGDPTKIQAETGWKPQVPLKTTLTDLLAYWRTAIRGEIQPNDEMTESLP
ncbi:MAG: GDP-mannose 4,6-dehydratase [Candidatus Sulfotelmatobacter sp.]